MLYVGVPPSRRKAIILTRPPIRTEYVGSEDLAWDCDRHVAFLREYARRDSTQAKGELRWALGTDYARYLLTTGRGEEAALARCLRFAKMYDHRDGGRITPWATVTVDGLRLDGSHRAAIAVVMGLPDVPVSVVPYQERDWRWREEMGVIRANKIRAKPFLGGILAVAQRTQGGEYAGQHT